MKKMVFLHLAICLVVQLDFARPAELMKPENSLADGDGIQISEYSARQARDDNCCGDLGCFDVLGAFADILKRPINPYPSCQTRVKFSLKTQDNVQSADLLNAFDVESVNVSHFRSDREGTKLLIHGYMDTENVRWMSLIEPKLLLQGDFNVIRVDWSAGGDISYFQAAANTRVVGAIVARLLTMLEKDFGQDLRQVHILGHSLGAHIAGYVGKRRKIGHITGLDPAGLYFKDMPASVRLDSSDADYVDTVVTDGRDLLQLGYGSMQPMGHVNFYPNGGQGQPGCGKTLLSSLWNFDVSGVGNDALGCSHFRAPLLYADTIANPSCTYTAVECDSYESFRTGNCFSCENDKCKSFGLPTENDLSGSGQRMYYLLTRDSAPYCESVYRVTIKIASEMRSTEKGMIKIQLNGATRSSEWTEFRAEAVEFQAGMAYSCLVPAPQNLGHIVSVQVTWEYDYSLLHLFGWLATHTLYLDPALEVTLLQNKPIRLRTDSTELAEKQIATFTA